MRRIGGKILICLMLGSVLGALSGCVDGPFYRLWYRKQWAEDETYAKEHSLATFYQRRDELKTLRAQAPHLSEDEQTRVAQQLTQSLPRETCPALRGDLVRTLSAYSVPAAGEGLRLALEDKESNVRSVACRALGKRQDPESLQALAQVLTADQDRDVRMAAARELGRFRDQNAVRALGAALDADDPALQFQAVQSLKLVSGKDFGNNVPAWRQFVRGEQVETEGPTLAEKMRRLF